MKPSRLPLLSERRAAFAPAALFAALLAVAAPVPAAAQDAAPEPVRAPVTISSRPTGADLVVDGAPLGPAPQTVRLLPGRHVARLAFPGAPAVYAEFESDESPSSASFDAPAPSAAVLLVSEPEGATVTRDGMNEGVTPLLLPEVEPGRHVFSFELTGYRPQQIETTVRAPAPVLLSARLVSASAALRVTSSPSGASVTLNGAPRGETPLDLAGIPEGEATIEILLAGHAPFRTQVRLSAGESFDLNAPLDPLPASLRVESIPAGARIYLDQTFRGEAPVSLDGLAPGEHRLRAELPGHDPAARTIVLAPGAAGVEEFRLRGNVGTLALSTSPAGVDVLIDGRSYGKTSAKADASDVVSDPLVLSDVPAGQHRLELSRPGYAPATRTLVIERDKTLTLPTATLERRFLPDVEVRTHRSVYRGVFVEKTPDFYRLETRPGLIQSIPLSDIVQIGSIRTDADPDGVSR